MSLHALVIDDDPLTQDVLGRLLALEGVGCTILHDPTDLLVTLERLERVDVVFLDLEMPGLNGYEVLKVLREALPAALPIAAYTVHLSEAVTAHREGFNAFLGKPLDPGAFPDQLRRILAGEAVWSVR